jgi:hypothetical protein
VILLEELEVVVTGMVVVVVTGMVVVYFYWTVKRFLMESSYRSFFLAN